METGYLIDSNAVIDYLMGKLPSSGMTFMNDIVNKTPNVSVITKIEVLGYNDTPDVLNFLRSFFNDAIVFEISNDAVEKTIELRKVHKIKLPDALIAATALVNNCSIITRNTSDFKKTSNLATLNPYEE